MGRFTRHKTPQRATTFGIIKMGMGKLGIIYRRHWIIISRKPFMSSFNYLSNKRTDGKTATIITLSACIVYFLLRPSLFILRGCSLRNALAVWSDQMQNVSFSMFETISSGEDYCNVEHLLGKGKRIICNHFFCWTWNHFFSRTWKFLILFGLHDFDDIIYECHDKYSPCALLLNFSESNVS